MVSLISVGIEKNKNIGKDSLADIPCAYSDAKRIYNTFEKVLEGDMKRYASVCIKDISAIECKVLLSSLELSIENNDILVFYFSGHGIVESNGKLKLVFSDYGYANRKGAIELGEIVSILKDYRCRLVLILDCCYSGAGLAESGKDDPKLEKSISILSSNGAIGKANYNQDGSEFTIAVCKALSKLYNEQKDISLNNIYKEVSKQYNKCKVMIGGGKEDIVLKKKRNNSLWPNFADSFNEKLNSVDYEMREALWYSVGYLPMPVRAAIVVAHQGRGGESSFAEMSWRVRRAMGSVLPFGENDKIDQCILDFLRADNWMEKCIGYISARKKLSDEMKELMCKELKNEDGNNPMDLIWLIALYLSEDADTNVNELVLNSNLMKSAWGAIEVWKRYYNNIPCEEKLSLFEEKMDVRLYKQLRCELSLRDESLFHSNDIPQQLKVYLNDILKLYQGKTRGRIEDSQNNKWIFSVLYGNWRDQVDVNEIMKKILRSKRPDYKNKFLRALKNIPSVEIKMAVLDFFAMQSKIEQFGIDIESLIWALADEHPWVVRSALPLFRGKKELVKKYLKKGINMTIYPGVFDLGIELTKQGFDGVEYEIKNMTDLERSQFEWARNQERKY